MSTVENLFVQIFERKNWIIEQVKRQTDLFEQNLASKLIIEGISPPPWLLNTHQSSNPRELNKEELISEILRPPPRLPTVHYPSARCSLHKPVVADDNADVSLGTSLEVSTSNKSFYPKDGITTAALDPDNNKEFALNSVPEFDVSLNAPLDQADVPNNFNDLDLSLARLQRSKSRQKALQLRNSAQAEGKGSSSVQNNCDVSTIGIGLSSSDQANHNCEVHRLSEHCVVSNGGFRESAERNHDDQERGINLHAGESSKHETSTNELEYKNDFLKVVGLFDVAEKSHAQRVDNSFAAAQKSHSSHKRSCNSASTDINLSDSASKTSDLYIKPDHLLESFPVGNDASKLKEFAGVHQHEEIEINRVTRSRSSAKQLNSLTHSLKVDGSADVVQNDDNTQARSPGCVSGRSLEVANTADIYQPIVKGFLEINEKNGNHCGRITRSRSMAQKLPLGDDSHASISTFSESLSTDVFAPKIGKNGNHCSRITRSRSMAQKLPSLGDDSHTNICTFSERGGNGCDRSAQRLPASSIASTKISDTPHVSSLTKKVAGDCQDCSQEYLETGDLTSTSPNAKRQSCTPNDPNLSCFDGENNHRDVSVKCDMHRNSHHKETDMLTRSSTLQLGRNFGENLNLSISRKTERARESPLFDVIFKSAKLDSWPQVKRKDIEDKQTHSFSACPRSQISKPFQIQMDAISLNFDGPQEKLDNIVEHTSPSPNNSNVGISEKKNCHMKEQTGFSLELQNKVYMNAALKSEGRNSTCILKDTDIVSVNKKGGHLAIEGNNGPEMISAIQGKNGPNVVENLQIVEKQPVIGGPLLLTNEVSGHGSRGCESEESEDDSEKEEEAEPMEDTSHQKNALGGNAVSKKRKAPETLPNSKKKKHRHDAVEKLDEQTKKQQDLTPNDKDMENNKGSAENSEDNHITHVTKKKTKNSHDAVENLDEQTKNQQDLTPNNKDMENNEESAESSEDNHTTHGTEKNDELQKSAVENIEATSKSDATKKKGPSRSARRKANKRGWLQEMAKIKEKNANTESEGLRNWKELVCKARKEEASCQPNGRGDDKASGQLKGHRNGKQQKNNGKREEVTGQPKGLVSDHGKQKKNNPKREEVTGQPKGLLQWKQIQGEDKNRVTNQEKHAEEKSKGCGKSSQSSDTEDEVVPVEIRPGHIRFEPLGKEQASKQSQVEVESFRWNGSMSKKKGQKWGQEKASFSQTNNSLSSDKQNLETVNSERQNWGQESVSFSQIDDSLDSNKDHSEMVNGEKGDHFCESIDFNTLPFLTGLPKEGLVIAYRLLELSSTWTPEVSSYRVGKVSQYNPEANRVLLIPVAEFPLIFSEDESSKQPDSSIYNGDGSLEIDFSSLLEVRLVKDGSPGPAGIPGRIIEHSAANESIQVLGSCSKKPGTPAAGAGEVNNGKQTQPTPSENGGVSLWGQLSETLKAKKAELSKESSPDKEERSGKGSWSYRAMRGGALGPTMAILRSKNEI